ncbi:restriction endonuclease subunit S [Pseudoflavonifractor sp. MSJ-37]|uniref:restriction endonuclease subunit S n=1 Tax=Pseudoflavonifractor sp. MSJ-37 TaxID=2841531 RepID=UPI001C0F8F2B|nr:restriction endonuclease subunit S [Pseudoflavonifractor sp. MSJ-37]MBU5435028.1 restriction endonuclease subunit S [Pseudoflavonifractor sp. MSJ-37]
MVKPWDTATIGDFLDFKNGLNKGKEFFGYGTPIVNYTDVYKKRGLKKNDVCGKVSLTRGEIRRFETQKNDVFFTRTSETPEEVGMSSVLLDNIDDCVFSGFVLRGRPKNDMFTPEYCKYCFTTEAVRNAITMGCTYTTRALTNGKQLSAIEIVVPPKPEQEAIAHSLTDIDELMLLLEKQIAKKKAIKQGAMQELLTGKRRLPGFEGEWNKCKLGSLGVFVKGTGISRNQSNSGNLPAVRYGELYTKHQNYVTNYFSHISEEVAANAQRVSRGDILFAASGETKEEIGKCAAIIHETDVYAGGDILIFRPATQLDPAFMGTLLNTADVCKQRAEKGQGDAVVHIHADALSSINVMIPNIEEQQAIADILLGMDKEIELLESKLGKYRQVKQGMMQQLLTGKIRLV